MGRPVNVLLQYWALDAFRAAAIDADHGLAFDSIRPGTRQPPAGSRAIPWLETFRMAKELGDMSIVACSGSLEVLGIIPGELDPIVDGTGRHRLIPAGRRGWPDRLHLTRRARRA